MGRKLFCIDFAIWCELEKCLERVETERTKMRENCILPRGVLNKGHPIRTRISWSNSSLGHSLTLVEFFFCYIICSDCKRNCRIFKFLPVYGLFITNFQLQVLVGWSNFHKNNAKKSKIFVDIKILHGHKKNTKHFLQVA